MEFLVPLLSALAGAVIGSVTTVIALLIQLRSDQAKHRRDLAVQLAMSDHAQAIDRAKANPPATVPPIAVYLAYHLKVLALASKGEMKAADLMTLNEFSAELKKLN